MEFRLTGLRQQGGGDFPKTYLITNACQSSYHDSGPKSFSAKFFELGGGGFTGFDTIMNRIAGRAIIKAMLSNLTSGKSLVQSTDDVKNGKGLENYAWKIVRVLLEDGEQDPLIRVAELDSHQKVTTEDYFIVDPSRTIGYSTITPTRGPVGTQLLFEVIIANQFLDNVKAAEFDIDNTGERITMWESFPGHWIPVGTLEAPSAQSYPRIDTFTWSAFDANGGVVGTGSSTFTLEGGAPSLSTEAFSSSASSGWVH